MDVESPLAMRKYAIWGIYKAVQLMVGLNDFRPRNYELYWRGGLVGWVGFNSGTGSHLSIGNGTANGTSHGVQVGSFPVSPNTLPNATNVDPGTNRIAFTFELHGRTIGESNVFMTLFTGILKAAPYPNVERVQDFFVNSGSFNSYMSFKERADLGPEGPFFRYELLIELFTYLPLWIIAQTSGWTEAEMYASVDDKVVGGGLMKCRFRLGVGAAAGGDVVIS